MAKSSTAKTSKTTKADTKTPVSKKSDSKKSKLTVGEFFTRNKKALLIGGVIIGLGILAFLGRGLFIAATVNGQPISRFKIIQEAEKQLGQTTLEKEITRSLVNQEASKNKVTVSESEIDSELKKISDQLKQNGQDLNEILQMQGVSQDDFRTDIRMQVLIQKMLGDDIKVSDQEVNDFLTQNEGILEGEEDQEKAKESLRQQLEQQKLSQKYQEWMTKIREDANIMQFVDY